MCKIRYTCSRLIFILFANIIKSKVNLNIHTLTFFTLDCPKLLVKIYLYKTPPLSANLSQLRSILLGGLLLPAIIMALTMTNHRTSSFAIASYRLYTRSSRCKIQKEENLLALFCNTAQKQH